MTSLSETIPLPVADRYARSTRGVALCICGLLMLAASGPLLWKFFQDLWQRPQYEFFPLLLAAVPFVGVVCLRDTPADRIRPGRVGVAVAIWTIACLMLSAGGLLYVRWCAPVAAWLTLAGIVWAVGGRGLAGALWPAGVLLLLVLPPPGHLDDAVLVGLRQWAVAGAGRLLDLLGVPQFTHGAVIDVPGDRLMVEEACSGINSMLAVLAFTVLLAFWKRLPAASLLLLVPAAALFVFWANVLRIVLCAAARVWYGVDLLKGTPHELLGLMLFVVCMALVFSAERLGAWLFDWDDAPAPAATMIRPAVQWPDARPWAAMAIVFVAVGAWTTWRTAAAWPASELPPGAAFTLPGELAGWTRVDEDVHAPERAEVSGRRSRVYQYRLGDRLAAVAVDYPFYGYHDATTCYGLAGWRIEGKTAHARADNGPTRVDVALTKPPLSFGAMRYALCDETGRWWQAPQTSPRRSWAGQKLTLSRERALASPLAQVQVLGVDYAPIDGERAAELDRLFDAAASAFAANVRAWREGRSQ